MPTRIARSSLLQKQTKHTSGTKRKSHARRDRNLDAFAIAQEQNPDAAKFRKHRLATTDIDREEPRRKRQRTSDDEDDQDDDDAADDDSDGPSKQRGPKRRDYDGLEAESGSDSEGNEWHFGFDADADDDEDIDSDEAFGESDDERFEDYTFRGSSGNKNSNKTQQMKTKKAEIDLDEDEEQTGHADDGDESDGSLGSDAVDLATMLDNPQDSDDETEVPSKKSDPAANLDTDSSSENEDDEDDYNPAKLAQLRSMVDTLENAEQPSDEDDDDEADLKPGALLAAMDSVANGNKKPSRKERRDKTKAADGPLAPPMAKRQQDKLNREAAYGKAKETLGRWQDTVKHNREADHLIFPLADPTANEAVGTSRMAPTSTSKPHNALESAIQGILEESGLATAPRKRDDADGDELPANKPQLKDVQARRAELRRARELLFREEQRAKRVKKIKSKAYRRVHRRERERADEQARALLAGADGEMSEEERERNDRRRAEERMGARHRESRWARQAKKTGQLAWNDDARAGVEDMARRDEELRHRIQGREPGGSDGSDEEELADSSDDDGFKLRTEEQLDELERDEPDVKTSRLASLKFMERAEAARKKETDDAIRELRRDIAGADASASEDEEPAGRRTYGPGAGADSKQTTKKPKAKQNEFGEGTPSASEAEDGDDDDGDGERIEPGAPTVPSDERTTSQKRSAKATTSDRSTTQAKVGAAAQPDRSTTTTAPTKAPKPSKTSKTQTKRNPDPILAHPTSSDDGSEASGSETNNLNDDSKPAPDPQQNAALIASAFAADDDAAIATFASEKRALARTEAPQRATGPALPGWSGSWSGAGLTERRRARRPRRDNAKRNAVSRAGAGAGAVSKKQASSNAASASSARREDADRPAVILSARRAKKSAHLLAGAVPFPYASGAQYEAGLRVPVGREWNAAGVVGERTMPRVVVRRGIVEPMERPM